MPFSAESLIHSLVAPVIMISACGLLCLALYNRLAAIVSRARAFNKERHELQLQLSALQSRSSASADIEEVAGRLDLLGTQVRQILGRARQVRNALQCLLVSILSMLGCSLATGISTLSGAGQAAFWGAIAFYVLGIISMGTGIVMAILELRLALEPASTEFLEAGGDDAMAGMNP
jgi:hypothetical protein